MALLNNKKIKTMEHYLDAGFEYACINMLKDIAILADKIIELHERKEGESKEDITTRVAAMMIRHKANSFREINLFDGEELADDDAEILFNGY